MNQTTIEVADFKEKGQYIELEDKYGRLLSERLTLLFLHLKDGKV